MNGKWYSLDVCDVEKILKTNAASGLTRKAARSRARKSGGNSFFFVGTKSISSCFLSVISDPLLLLLIGVDVIAALFGETTVALSAAALIFINVFLTFIAYFRSQRIIESMAGFSQPKLRVIRDGELFLFDSRGIVPGDVILLSAGDILPADARLISSAGLEMSVYTGKDNDAVTVHPDAELIYPRETVASFYEYKNMLYAGSVVVSGEARAIVVETGETSYIGALEGGIPLNEANQRSEYLREMKSFSSRYGFAVLIMILPLTVAGILSYGSDHILSTFMLTLSLAVSSLGELIYVIGNISTGSTLLDCALKRRGSAMIRSAGRASVIAKTDRVLLIGNASVTDGIKRVSAMYVGDKVLRGQEMLCTSAVRLCERGAMLNRTARAFPSAGGKIIALPGGFDGLCRRLEIDEEAINIRCTPLSFLCSGTRMTASLNDGDQRISIIAAQDESIVDLCSSQDDSGNIITLGSERKQEIKKAFRSFMAEGNEAFIIITSSGSATVFNGVLAFRSTVSPEIPKRVYELRAAGVEVTLVLDNESVSDTSTAIRSGIVSSSSEIAYFSRYHHIGHTFNDIPENCRAILGFSANDIREYVVKLKRAGHTVSVFATSARSYPAFAEGDVSITCDRNEYSASMARDNDRLELALPSGEDSSPDGSQIMRFSSDVMVKRASHKGGGVEGIYNAIAYARSLQRNLARAVAYLMCTQLARLCFVLPAMLLGRELLSPFQLLFSGLILDMAAMFVLALDRPNRSLMERKYRPASLKTPIRNCRMPLLIVGCGAALGSITAILISFITNEAVSGAVFASLVLTQLILLFYIRNDEKPKDTLTIPFVSSVLVCAVAVLLCGAVPYLSDLTQTRFSLVSLICLPIAPAAVAIGHHLWSFFKKLIKKT